MRIGDWTADYGSNSISRNGATKLIQPLSMSILLYLADNADRVVSSQELIDQFWANRVVGDDAVHRRIADLRKKLEDDTRHPTYISTTSKRGYRLIANVERPTTKPITGRRTAMKAIVTIAVLLVVAGALLAGYLIRQESRIEGAVIQAEALLAEDRYQEAYVALAPYAHRTDAAVVALLGEILLPVSIVTQPDGVEVAFRFSSPDSEWTPLGATPISGLSLPRGHLKLRFGDSVYMDATNPGVTLNSAGRDRRVIDMPQAAIPPEMVFIPGGKYRLGAWGFVDDVDLGSFLIDRLEVSNRDYLEFVEAGGYQDKKYWQELIDDSQGKLTWSIVREDFVDRTGEPGPAGWERGSYVPGTQALPVVGISWYEANAYLEYRNKSLPSAHHWLRATLGPMEWKYPFAPQLVPRSNVGSEGLLPAERQLIRR